MVGIIDLDGKLNEQICQQLLGWRRVLSAGTEPKEPAIWHRKVTDVLGEGGMPTPAFDRMEDCGLILDAWARLGYRIKLSLRRELDGGKRSSVSIALGDELIAVTSESDEPEAIRITAIAWLASQGLKT
jgi:hypothetical protein